jgi:NADH-quinone oxidoreductase subunit N
MDGTDIIAFLPFIVLAAAITAIMLVIAFRRSHGLTVILSLIGLALSIAALFPAGAHAPRQVTPLFAIDGYALFYMGLIFTAAIAVVFLSHGYLASRPGPPEEYYLLLLLATLGAAALVASTQFASFFLGLETLSIALLGLIAYPQGRARPIEAGIKYLMLAGISSAFLLFGMALVYARLGTMEFARIAAVLRGLHEPLPDIYWLTGIAMIVTGLGFKLSVVPFHMWAPDVYEGAPAPVTAFVAVVSKSAVFALLLRYFATAGVYGYGSVMMAINVIAIASMLVGNLLALLQGNVKRILAYSSIAHLGYLLVAFMAGGALAVEAVTYYLVAYVVMTLGAFGIVTILSAPSGGAELEALEDYRGLMWRRPWLAGMFTAMLLSLAGIPLTVGFMAKFFAMSAGISAALWPAVFALVAGSVIGLFYYLRIIVAMVLPAEAGAPAAGGIVPWAGGTTVAIITLVLVWLGIYPAPLIQIIRLTALHIANG